MFSLHYPVSNEGCFLFSESQNKKLNIANYN